MVAVVGLRPGCPGQLPALCGLRTGLDGGVPLDDLPPVGRPERLGFPVLPQHPQPARRLAGGGPVDGGLHAALVPRRSRSWSSGIGLLGSQAAFDAEKIMPLVLHHLPVGLRGVFHGRAAGGTDVDAQRHDQRHQFRRAQRLSQAAIWPGALPRSGWCGSGKRRRSVRSRWDSSSAWLFRTWFPPGRR